MIDTIRFMIPLYDKLSDAVKSKSFETVRTDQFYGWEDFRKHSTYITLNRSKLSIFTYEDDYLFMEGSMPKLYYGHNISMLYPSQLPELLQMLENALRRQFEIFPTYDTWRIQRLDMCYAYKLASTEDVESMLELLSTLRYPRKSFHYYPKETVSFGARSYSLKFYSKEKEFIKKDGKEMIRDGYVKEASELSRMSNGILRYEITNRKANLNQILKDTNKTIFTYKDIMDINLYYNYLNKVQGVLFKGANTQTMTDIQVWQNLKSKYKESKAKKYFMFYKMLYLPEPFAQHFIHKKHNPTTVKRTIEALNQAQVGIPSKNLLYDFNLSIPNKYVINSDLLPAAEAAGRFKRSM